jgi:hypothetical protein
MDYAEELNRATHGLLAKVWAEVTAPRDPHTREPIEFSLKNGQNKYLYYRGKSGAQYCYTPHKDTRGYYWCWTYKPRGKGSRSGKPQHWKLTNLVRFSRRNKAKARAWARAQKGGA